MPRTNARHEQRPPPRAVAPGRGLWLTRAAFVLAASLVVARATMLETLRNPLDVYPGSEPVPRGPGAATGVVLDLLGCVPALLVLVRRAVDLTYLLRFAWSLVPMALLALWAVASVAWAGDRFAAAVASFHWLAASVLLWSVAQLVRHWLRLRLVAAVCFGLLLVQAGEGFYKKFVEYPELRAQWEKSKDEILRQRGWEPGSFHATQFEKRVISGEIMGFTSSSNSYAAVLVLLSAVSAGVVAQRLGDRDDPGWAAVVAAGVAASAAMIVLVGSRTAYATTLLGAATFAGVWILRRRLSARPRLAYAAGAAAVALALAAVVGHGVYHGSLFPGRFGDSLNFRWRYWVGSARLVAQHPLLGVGWENFGPHYLSVRLPVASEEIKDPHNFLVRFAAELGVVGLALVAAWMLLLWWDLTTRPAAPADLAAVERLEPAEPPLPVIGPGARSLPYKTSFALGTVVAIGAGGVLLNVLATIDWGQSAAFVSLELMRRVGYLCLFVVGAASVALHSMARQELDDRPAPWVLYGALVGLGLFLVHNLLDFSLFEPGPMALFAFVCGAALGTRLPDTSSGAASRTAVLLGAIAAVVLWVAAALAFAAPVVVAEEAAYEGDDALRRGAFDRAAGAYEQAAGTVPYNADYPARAGRALLLDPGDPRPKADRIFRLLDRAVALNPHRPDYWLSRANAELLRPSPDPGRLREGHERALALDPNNVEIRLDYAAVLRRLGDAPGALEQYRTALRYNDLLSPGEPKRLPPARLEEVRKAIAEVEGQPAAR